MPEISRKEMSEVRIGPKSFRSYLHMGTVSKRVWQEIERAEEKRLGKQMFNFNLYLGQVKVNGALEDQYVRAFVINGHCRFKRYNLLDVLVYKIVRLFRRG